jgi:5-methyltetrahydrofolate--homocysteine methyltransferase
MEPLLERLKRDEILVGDGAMGTMLFERGLKTGDCPEKWNADRPEVLEEIARLYFEAGADLIETNTFGGSPLKLAQYDLDRQTEELNVRAVRAVRAAVGDRAYISGSCGPTGCILQPFGDTDPEDISAAFERQLKALAAEGVDLFCIETMTDLNEAILAIKAARSVAPSMPIAATMTFDATPRGFFTVMGVTIEQAARGLAEAGADIIGSNCGNGIENMVGIAREFRQQTDRPLIIQSNAGLPEMRDGMVVYTESPEFMADKARMLLDAGVRIVGGCCGTTPEHIAAFRRIVDARAAV